MYLLFVLIEIHSCSRSIMFWELLISVDQMIMAGQSK
jgi:hypothetical protein